MKKVSFNKVYEIETPKRERDHLGEAISEHFGKPLYWIKHKFGVARTQRILDIMQKENDTDIKHLMQNLHHD